MSNNNQAVTPSSIIEMLMGSTVAEVPPAEVVAEVPPMEVGEVPPVEVGAEEVPPLVAEVPPLVAEVPPMEVGAEVPPVVIGAEVPPSNVLGGDPLADLTGSVYADAHADVTRASESLIRFSAPALEDAIAGRGRTAIAMIKVVRRSGDRAVENAAALGAKDAALNKVREAGEHRASESARKGEVRRVAAVTGLRFASALRAGKITIL